MILPDDVLSIIKEYSQPLTRPDWRRLHIMTQESLTNELLFRPCIYIGDIAIAVLFKNIILIFEDDVFCVFRFHEYLNIDYHLQVNDTSS